MVKGAYINRFFRYIKTNILGWIFQLIFVNLISWGFALWEKILYMDKLQLFGQPYLLNIILTVVYLAIIYFYYMKFMRRYFDPELMRMLVLVLSITLTSTILKHNIIDVPRPDWVVFHWIFDAWMPIGFILVLLVGLLWLPFVV